MARPLRIEFPGGLYHITSRGDRREDIFLDEGDRLYWLELLGQTCARFNWKVHAYCLMDNHFHIVVETVEGNLSAGMRQLNGVYTQWHNRTHGRVGHVFQGRFKAIVVHKQGYLLELARYVVLNPVRAGMCDQAEDWLWSSYHATAGIKGAPTPPWLHTDWLLAQFEVGGLDKAKAQAAYRNHVRAGMGLPSIWQALQGAVKSAVILGDERFAAKVMAQARPSQLQDPEIPRLHRRAAAPPIEHFVKLAHKTQDRNAAIEAAWQTRRFSQREIGEAFGLHYASVSRLVRRVG
jgi:putative transposase